MPPSHFYVRLQHGITGGFAPPTPLALHVLVRSNFAPAHIVVNSSIRPDGQPSLPSAVPKNISVDAHAPLVEELHSILKALPTEQPRGSEDIYGLDISIAWGSDDLEWCNGGPSGCGGGNSVVKASAEEKQKFQRAVDIVNELITKDA